MLCAQVIDDQVDALAANAVKALGSLWGGLNTVAKTSWGLTKDITTKVGVLGTLHADASLALLISMGHQSFLTAEAAWCPGGRGCHAAGPLCQLSHAVCLQHGPPAVLSFHTFSVQLRHDTDRC
jgi:hypothetical protein